jgi:hypothetical protein
VPKTKKAAKLHGLQAAFVNQVRMPEMRTGSLFFGLLLFERIAGAPVFDESVGVIRASAPVAARADERFLGDEVFTIAAFELFVFYLVIAGFPE